MLRNPPLLRIPQSHELTSPVAPAAPLGRHNRPTPRSPTPFTHPGLTHACGPDSPFPLGASSRVLPSAWMALLHTVPSGPGHRLPQPQPAPHLLAGLPHPPGTSSSFLAFPVTNTIFFPANEAAMASPGHLAARGSPSASSCRHFRMAAEGDGLACEPGKGSFGIPTRASYGEDSLSALGAERLLWAPGVLAQTPGEQSALFPEEHPGARDARREENGAVECRGLSESGG